MFHLLGVKIWHSLDGWKTLSTPWRETRSLSRTLSLYSTQPTLMGNKPVGENNGKWDDGGYKF